MPDPAPVSATGTHFSACTGPAAEANPARNAGDLLPGDETDRGHLCDAITRAVRDIRPRAAAVDAETLAAELDARISAYWGAHHGISRAELAVIAQDVQASIRQRAQRR